MDELNERIVRKIEACLALAGSDNPNEAATALRQAQKLMAEYGLTHLDLATARISEQATKTRAGKTPPGYLGGLVSMVANAFGTHPIYRRQPSRTTASSELAFIGPESNARISAYAFEVLQRQLIRDRSQYLAALSQSLKRATKIRRANAFAEAWVVAVSQHVIPQTMDEARMKAIEHYVRKNYGALNSLTPRQNSPLNRYDRTALSAGYQAGQAVQFNQGVESTARAALSHR